MSRMVVVVVARGPRRCCVVNAAAFHRGHSSGAERQRISNVVGFKVCCGHLAVGVRLGWAGRTRSFSLCCCPSTATQRSGKKGSTILAGYVGFTWLLSLGGPWRLSSAGGLSAVTSRLKNQPHDFQVAVASRRSERTPVVFADRDVCVGSKQSSDNGGKSF